MTRGAAGSAKAGSANTSMRLAVAAVVPSLGIAAHAMASGMVPTAGPILASVGVGVLAASALTSRRRRTTAGDALAATLILTGAQLGAHLTLSVGTLSGGGMAGGGMVEHAGLLGGGHAMAPMVFTHVVAVPASAVAIALMAALVDVLTSSLPTLCRPLRYAAWAPVVGCWNRRRRPAACGVVVGGRGLRGPPQPC